MKPFNINKILVPLDFSETSLLALDHAVLMAKLFRAELTFVHVFESFPYREELSEVMITDTRIGELVTERMKEIADKIKQETGVMPVAHFISGNVTGRILEVAQNENVDIIIMGTHGKEGIEEFFLGSNAYKVLTQADCPVMSVQTHAKRLGFKNIVLPLDVTMASREKFKYAVELAKKYNSRLHVGVLMVDESQEMQGVYNILVHQVEKYLAEHDLTCKIKYLKGKNKAKMTLEYADEVDADLIMFMTEQNFEFSGMIMGPYAQQLVHHSTIPVMAITPTQTDSSFTFPY